MSLQSLINHYVAKTKEIDKLIETKRNIEERMKAVFAGKVNIKNEINSLFPQTTHELKTYHFLATVEGKPTVVQIDFRYHPKHDDFLTFCEVTPIEEFGLSNETEQVNNILDGISATIKE